MIPKRNPKLVAQQLTPDFWVAFNPFIANGIKLLNSKQYDFLQNIDGEKSITELAFEGGVQADDAEKLIDVFSKKGLANYEGKYITQQWPKNPQTLGFWLHTTNQCTLNCHYCYIKTKNVGEHFSSEMQELLFDKIVETVKARKLKRVSLRLAGGEPLLRFEQWVTWLDNLNEVLSDANCSLKVSLLSNMTVLNEAIIDYLAQSSFVYLGVSLDGLDQFHDGYRVFRNGEGSFRLVRENLSKLLESGIRPSIMATVSSSSMKGLPQLTEFIIKERLSFRYTIIHDEELNRNELIKILQDCYDIFERAIETDDYPFEKLHHFCELKFSDIWYQTCSNGFNGGNIYIDGSVYFCQKQFGKAQPIGSITEENNDLIDIIQRGRDYKDDISQECKQCLYRYICTSGCPLERRDGKAPDCEVYKALIPRILTLIGKDRLRRIERAIVRKN